MAVELDLPTIHGTSGDLFDHFTSDGIAFDQSAKKRELRHQEAVNPDQVNELVAGMLVVHGEQISPEEAETILTNRSDRSFYGHALKTGQEILAESQTPVEAKTKLVATGRFKLQTYSPGELLSILEYYGSNVNKEPFNWLAVSTQEEGRGRFKFNIKNIMVLIETVQANTTS